MNQIGFTDILLLVPHLAWTDVKTLPEKPIAAHPAHPFPHFLTVLPKLPKEVKSAQDVQQCEFPCVPRRL